MPPMMSLHKTCFFPAFPVHSCGIEPGKLKKCQDTSTTCCINGMCYHFTSESSVQITMRCVMLRNMACSLGRYESKQQRWERSWTVPLPPLHCQSQPLPKRVLYKSKWHASLSC